MNNSTNFHPTDSMLIEFSAGSLGVAPSICVSAHLHFCASCRAQLKRLDQVGGQLLGASNSFAVDDDAFDKLMEKIVRAEEPVAQENSNRKMPFSVNKLLSKALVKDSWQRLTSSVAIARFRTGQEEFEVALHKIFAGGKTPKHDHHGLEYTVVLKGSFSDEHAVYREGDFLVRKPGDVHQPMGANNGECICLSALSAPIKLTNPLGFLMQPWLRINPM